MSSLKELRLRIRSVKNTQQITKTMKMVAAAKVRRTRQACEDARPYAERLGRVLANLAAKAESTAALPLLCGRENEQTVRILVFGSDRGLCGGFNGNLVRRLMVHVHTLQKTGKTVQVVTHGRKPKDLVKVLQPEVLHGTFDGITERISYATAEEIARKVTQDFEAGACDRVELFYNSFVSMMTQKPTLQTLVPFTQEGTDAPDGAVQASMEYEPSEQEVLGRLLPANISMQVYRAMLESAAGEQAARMVAMDNATRNAGEMIKGLSLRYNRTRQAAITKELIEIISGAEAV